MFQTSTSAQSLPSRSRPRAGAANITSRINAEAMLSGEKWHKISWRRGTKGRLTCLFAARRVRVADGHKHRMLDNRVHCMPGDEVWLVGERQSTGEQKYYVSNLRARLLAVATATSLKGLASKRRSAQLLNASLLRLRWEENGVRADLEQLAQISVSHLGDAPQPFLSAGGVLRWREH